MLENCMDEIRTDERDLFHAHFVISTGLGIFYTRRNESPGMNTWVEAEIAFASARLTMGAVDLSRVRETVLQLLGFRFIGNDGNKRKWQLPLWSIFAFPHDTEVVCCHDGKHMKIDEIDDCKPLVEFNQSGNNLCTPYYIEINSECWDWAMASNLDGR